MYAADKLGQFFTTGPTVVSSEPSHSQIKVCRKYVSIPTHGPHEQWCRVNPCWSRGRFRRYSGIVPYSSRIFTVSFLLVDLYIWNADSNLVTRCQMGVNLEGEKRVLPIWDFVWTWNGDTIRQIAVSVLERFTMDASRELSMLESKIAAKCDSSSVLATFGGLHALAETYVDFLGKGNRQKLIDYPNFDLRLLKRCLRKVLSSVFGSFDPFSMTEFIVTRLKVAEHCTWMISRSSLGCAINTGELTLSSLFETVANIVDVWPPIVSYLNETGSKHDGDSFV